jgi:hypothetical protein
MATGRLKPKLRTKRRVVLNNELPQLLVLSINKKKWNPLLDQTNTPWTRRQ